MADFFWFRAEFPWLDQGFVHAVAEGYADRFVTCLRAHDFEILEIDGREQRNLHDQLSEAFGLPDHRSDRIARPPDATPNRDSLNDYFGDTELPARAVLLWRRADRFAARHPKIFAEACAMFTDIFNAASVRQKQLVLVLAGKGADFRRPPAAEDAIASDA